MYVWNASLWISTLCSQLFTFSGFLFFCCFFYWNEHLPQCCLLHLLIYLLIYLFLLALHCWTKKHSSLLPKAVQTPFFVSALLPIQRAFDTILGLRELFSLDGDAVHGATRGRNNPILVCVCCYSLLCSLPTFLALFKFIYLCFFCLLMVDSATKYVLLRCVLCWRSPTTDFGTLRVAFIDLLRFIYYFTSLQRIYFQKISNERNKL